MAATREDCCQAARVRLSGWRWSCITWCGQLRSLAPQAETRARVDDAKAYVGGEEEAVFLAQNAVHFMRESHAP